MSLLFKITNSLFKAKKTVKICFLGLDGAGKSSIIKKIISNDFNESLDKRTLGMSVEKISTKGLNFIAWDLGGQKAFRDSLWNTYMKGAQGLIYVIDSTNEDRLKEAKNELFKYIFANPGFVNLPILILANKQDLIQANSAEIIAEKLDISTKYQTNIKIFPVSCKSGLNLEKALEWLAQEINRVNYVQSHVNRPIVQTINI